MYVAGVRSNAVHVSLLLLVHCVSDCCSNCVCVFVCVLSLFCYAVLSVLSKFVIMSSLQCYSVLSDILVKNELCIPLER